MKRILLVTGIGIIVLVGAAAWLQAAPTIGATALTPAYVVINQPSQVLVTSSITDPSLIPTSVNLLRTDASGKTISIVGVMKDDGLNGDALAGDKTFSLRLNINEPAIGQQHYRVSAAFRGVLQRALSSVQALHIDPFQLPPDPGEAGKATIAGIDSDADGVRDDVQRYITIAHSNSERARKSLEDHAVNLQAILVNTPAPSKLPQLWMNSFSSTQCINDVFGIEADKERYRLEAEFLNTRERSRSFFQASRFPPSAAMEELANPSAQRVSCNLDLRTLPN